MLDGEDDFLPDMFIGRIPVKTGEEADDYLDKIKQYAALTPEEWQKKIVTPVSDTIFCLEEEGITWERYHKYLENCDREEEENKKTRAEKIKEQRKARQGEKVRLKKWLKEIKKEFSGDTDYMKEGFERGKSAEEEYSKFQIKIINSLTNNSYFKEDRLFWNGFRKGLVARKKTETE